jgi:uncharacterized protein (TIGR02270 family)
VATLQALAEAGGPLAEPAAVLAVRRLDVSQANAWRQRLARKPALARVAVAAAGSLGDPDAVPWLIEQMQAPPLARAAGEAFSLITGTHVAYDKLEGKKPEGFEAGPTENPADENVAMDADQDLPWPDPKAVQVWWQANAGRFARGTRHLLGKPISVESACHALAAGRQRQRAAAALELALLRPGRPLYEVRQPGFRQQRDLPQP